MKRPLLIGLVLLLAMASCRDPVETRHGTSLQPAVSPKLSAIDSLMWQQPDSALAVLMEYFSAGRDVACNVSNGAHCDTLGGDVARYVSTNETFDHHYAHLLLAELLYKNDYAQSNCADLQQAVGYFDSLVVADTRGVSLHRFGRRDAPRASASNMSIAFLDARAHYINGVGYYESDSVVEACKEYLKALETMEGHLEEKELIGNKAKFMALTNNRLLDLFSGLFMQEPAIVCAKQSLFYNEIEPLKPYSCANNLSKIGLQFDKLRETDSATFYYKLALEALPDRNNVIYRDVVASMALLAYNSGLNQETALDSLKSMAMQAADNEEKLTRHVTIGDIYYDLEQYDSAKVYLDAVYRESSGKRAYAASRLRDISLYEGDTMKANSYSQILFENPVSLAESNAKISQLNDLFQTYLNQKQEKKSIEDKRNAIRNTVSVIVPVAVILVLSCIFFLQHKSMRLIKREHRLHEMALESQRDAHRMEQAALSGRLKKSNEVIHELKDQIKKKNMAAATMEQATTFDEEPICRLIMQRVNDGQFLSQMDCTIYRDYALDKNQLSTLRVAVDRHFGQFTVRLAQAYPALTKTDLDYCCLYLLGLTDADVAALMQRAYNTVNERNNKLRRIFGSESAISATLQAFANKQLLY